MEWLIFWVVMAAVVAIIAHSKGLSGGLWFLYGFLIWPIALVHALVSPRADQAEKTRGLKAGRRPCPHCAEMIRPEARVCPHCQRDLTPNWAMSSP